MINEILDYMDYLYPIPKCELEYNKDYEFLISIMLSAQTTDKRVNKVSKVLFKKYTTIEDLANANIDDIIDIIRELGTFRRKSVYVKEIATRLKNDGYKKVPNDRDYIESLPGVGRKTANVFLSNIHNVSAIAVDTHVKRVSNRLGLVNTTDVSKIEHELENIIPKDKWGKTHHQFVLFGRYHCKAIKPDCINCKLNNICKYYNKK